MIGMTDKEFVVCIKQLVFDESIDEQATPEDGFKIGIMSNEDLFDEVSNLILYYKEQANE